MAKRKKNGSRKRKFRVHVSGWLAGYGIARPAYDAIKRAFQGNDAVTVMNNYQANYTGYDFVGRTWIPEATLKGSVPIAMGMGMHEVNKAFDVNKKLGAMKVPLIRM